jgi:hypothetical protein
MIGSSQLSVILNNVLLINQLLFIACFIESFSNSSIIKPIMPHYEGVYLEKLLKCTFQVFIKAALLQFNPLLYEKVHVFGTIGTHLQH